MIVPIDEDLVRVMRQVEYKAFRNSAFLLTFTILATLASL